MRAHIIAFLLWLTPAVSWSQAIEQDFDQDEIEFEFSREDEEPVQITSRMLQRSRRRNEVRSLASRYLSNSVVFAIGASDTLQLSKPQLSELHNLEVNQPVDLIAEILGSERSELDKFYHANDKDFSVMVRKLRSAMAAEEATQRESVKEIIGASKFRQMQQLQFESTIEESPMKAIAAIGITASEEELRKFTRKLKSLGMGNSRRSNRLAIAEAIDSVFGSRVDVSSIRESAAKLPAANNQIDLVLSYFGGPHQRLRKTHLRPGAKCHECGTQIRLGDRGYRVDGQYFLEACFLNAVIAKQSRSTPKGRPKRRTRRDP